MNEQEFKHRTKQLALRIIRLVEALPAKPSSKAIGGQLVRCGTSVGANYRAACRGRSPAEVIAKLGIVEEEADETLYWMELLIEAGLIAEPQLKPLMNETGEILAMTVCSIKTLRRRSAPIQSRQTCVANPKSKIQNPPAHVF
jgi:four helix bundle protein